MMAFMAGDDTAVLACVNPGKPPADRILIIAKQGAIALRYRLKKIHTNRGG
jgi:hypothetical protein